MRSWGHKVMGSVRRGKQQARTGLEGGAWVACRGYDVLNTSRALKSISNPRAIHKKKCHNTMVQNNQESKLKYWAIRLSIYLFACTVHSFAFSPTSILQSLWGMIKWLYLLCFFLFWTIVHGPVLTGLASNSLPSWQTLAFALTGC